MDYFHHVSEIAYTDVLPEGSSRIYYKVNQIVMNSMTISRNYHV